MPQQNDSNWSKNIKSTPHNLNPTHLIGESARLPRLEEVIPSSVLEEARCRQGEVPLRPYSEEEKQAVVDSFLKERDSR